MEEKKKDRFDQRDAIYYGGLLMLGIGLVFGFSWQIALIVVGAILVVVSVINSYIVVLLSK